MLKTGEQRLVSQQFSVVLVCTCHRECVFVCVGGTQMESDPSQLVPKTGRHEAFHLVCKEPQRCKECAEELKAKEQISTDKSKKKR